MTTWVQTRSNKAFDLVQPSPAMVDIYDIACSLSRLCRYNGHGSAYYSVAQHSVLVSEGVEEELVRRRGHVLYADSDRRAISKVSLWGLLHDAAEAYVGDLVSPVKQVLRLVDDLEFDDMEKRVLAAICQKFDLPEGVPDVVWEYDLRLLATERRDLFGPCQKNWKLPSEPLTAKIEPWSMEVAESAFLSRFSVLQRGR
jgi:hypothetical protein